MRVEIVMVHMKLCHASSGNVLFGQQKDSNIVEIGHNASGDGDGARTVQTTKVWQCNKMAVQGNGSAVVGHSKGVCGDGAHTVQTTKVWQQPVQRLVRVKMVVLIAFYNRHEHLVVIITIDTSMVAIVTFLQ